MASSNNRSNERVEDVPDCSMENDRSELLHDIHMTPATRFSTNTNNKKKMTTNETETIETMATTITTTTPENVLANEDIPELESPELQVGDHVYQWRSLLGVPFMFQHHGIVMDIIKDEEGKPVRLTIADFSNAESDPSKKKGNNNTSNKQKITENPKESVPNEPAIEEETPKKGRTPLFSSRVSLEQDGIMHTYTDTDKWHKVHYESGWWKSQLSRSGTVTRTKSDPVGLVLARVHFIIRHPEQLPDYHVVHANCECVAFWCKTGSWCTLQASSFLELTAAGQVKQTATLAATAAGTTATVTVPASGIWGSWFGFTTTSSVSWLSLHPMAIPGLACYAAITVGVPAIMYATANKKWKATSQRLTDAFWDSANENPEVFAECLTHWSEKG